MLKRQIKKVSFFSIVFIAIFILSCSKDENGTNQKSSNVDFKKMNYEISLLFQNSELRLDDSQIYITEDGAILTLSQYLEGCVQNLRGRGFSDAEIIEEFGSLQNPAIIVSVNWLNKIEYTLASSQARQHADVYDCLLRAIGIDAVVELFNGKVTKSIAKKAIRKIVSRTAGWVGAAIAIYEFSDCMGAFE